MKFGLSFVTLTSVAVLALSASAAQGRVRSGEAQTSAKAQAAKTAEAWYQAEAHFFEGMTRSQIQHLRHQFQQQTTQHSPRPDDCAGLRAILCST
jgi:hypothetical protein